MLILGRPSRGELQPAPHRGVRGLPPPDRGRGREEPDPHHQLLANPGQTTTTTICMQPLKTFLDIF